MHLENTSININVTYKPLINIYTEYTYNCENNVIELNTFHYLSS